VGGGRDCPPELEISQGCLLGIVERARQLIDRQFEPRDVFGRRALSCESGCHDLQDGANLATLA